jgi:hypothetical protein
MKITIYNDGKEKPEQFEAVVNDNFTDSDYFGTIDLTGYGKNQAEAKKNLAKLIEKVLLDLKGTK